jgi:hypothetical protein
MRKLVVKSHIVIPGRAIANPLSRGEEKETTAMQRRNTPRHPDFNGWFSGRALRQELQAALHKRRPLTKR